MSSARPSMRILVASTESRMVWYSSSPNSLDSSAAFQPLASACSASEASTSFFSAEIASLRSSLSRTAKAWVRRSPMAALSASTTPAVAAGRGPGPLRLAGFGDELVDGVDGDLHLLVTEHHRAQHHVFGQFIGFGFDHQHRVGGAGDDQLKLRIDQLGLGRVEDVLRRPCNRPWRRRSGRRTGRRTARPRRTRRAAPGCRRRFPGSSTSPWR